MVKVQAIIDFTYKNYDKIQNLNSSDEIEEGKIFKGDIFEIENEEALYLAGKNDFKIEAVKILEVTIDKLVNIEKDKVETEHGSTNITQTKDEITISNMRIVKDEEEAKEIVTRARKKINKKKEEK